MAFPRTLAQSEMKTALFRFWTQFTVSIYYNNDPCAKHAFTKNYQTYAWIEKELSKQYQRIIFPVNKASFLFFFNTKQHL